MTKSMIFHLLFYWITPLATTTGIFLIIKDTITRGYEKFNIDQWITKFVTWGVILGCLVGFFIFLTQSDGFKQLIGITDKGMDIAAQQETVIKLKKQGLYWWQAVLQFVIYWLPVYFRAWLISWVFCSVIAIQSLIWRINFGRGANIIISTAVLYPWLTLKYLFGYQTPFFDYVQARLFVARLKENLNDSYFEALSGYDDKGNKFENGAGGTVQTQRIKQTALAVRQTKAKIKTAGGTRHAELITRQSRETDTDKLIEIAMNGLGQRLSAPSIRFQDSPVLNVERGGYIFDSDVSYNAGDSLENFHSIFANPFSTENSIRSGGLGPIKTFMNDIKGLVHFIAHLTPVAIYEYTTQTASRIFSYDTSIDHAKFIAQQNLDLSVLPDPIDPDTDNDIATQKVIAQKVARQRIDDVTNALNNFKIRGSFSDVKVGGNSAVYEYTLARDANIPTDFDKIQTGIANMLKTKDIPVISISAGILSLSMVNGVNIPIDFKEMAQKRSKGMPSVVTGLAGVDALGKDIQVSLGDKTPHMILFGKTGTGKTVTIMTILYSIMDAVDPSMLKIAYIDGKGNSFEFMRTDNSDSSFYHPNPFTYAQPADASGDIDYARALLKHFANVTRKRIDLFKKAGVSKLADYNRKFPDKKLPVLLLVNDEFSAITQQDKNLKGEDLIKQGTIDNYEYIAKMSRSVGIHMLLANQSARKELVPGKITANIPGRISLGVSEPIESDIALPDSGIAVNLISQPGEFYSAMNGSRNIEHGNSPYLTDDNMYALNDSLEAKFGHSDYEFTREQILNEMENGDLKQDVKSPNPLPTDKTPIDELITIINDYPEWSVNHRKDDLFSKMSTTHFMEKATPKMAKERYNQVQIALDNAELQIKALHDSQNATTHKATGELVSTVTHGADKGII